MPSRAGRYIDASENIDFNPIIAESIFLLAALTKLRVFRCTAISTIFLEAFRILMFDDIYHVSWSSEYFDVRRCLPNLQGLRSRWYSSLKQPRRTFSPNSCAMKPLTHRARMILISSFVFDAKLFPRVRSEALSSMESYWQTYRLILYKSTEWGKSIL